MPIAKVQLPDGRIGRFEVKEGTTPEEIEAFVAENAYNEFGTTKVDDAQESDVPDWGRDNPNLYGAYGAGKALLEDVASPIIEGVATVVGGMGASPIIGSSIGYAAGKQVTDIIEEAYAKLGGEEGKDRSIAGELKNVGKDVATGVAMSKVMKFVGSPIQTIKNVVGGTLRGVKKLTDYVPQLTKTGKYVFEDLPKRLYGSAANIPISKTWIKELPGRELSKREAVIVEGLKEKVPLSSLGKVKTVRLEKDVKQVVDEAHDVLSKYPDNKIKTSKLVEDALKKSYARAKTGATPVADKKAIDSVKKEMLDRPEFITFKEANTLKRSIWKKSNWGEATDPTTKSAQKDVGREVNKIINETYPELKLLNETDAARIGLKDVIEKSVASQANKPLVEFSTKYMVVHPKMWPVAVWNSTVGHPRIKANIAFGLAHANPEKFSRFIYPEMPAGYTAAKEIALTGTYRYAPKSVLTKSKIPKAPKVTLRPAHEQIPVNKLATIVEREEAQRVKELERIFKAQQSRTGPPLMRRTVTDYTKSKIPSVEGILKGLKD